jgi:ribosomal-protein-alanine N-acetyltransferase
MIIETDRLLMRPVTRDDLPVLLRFRADPEVSRYLGGPEMSTPEFVAKRLEFYLDCHRRYGFGMCALLRKDDREMIGWSGIQPLEDSGEIEVGYGFDRPFWGRGYATEAANAFLRYGFETANLQRIVAVASPENTASRHVMEKLGMRYERNARHYNSDCVFYAIAREEFTPLPGFYAVHDEEPKQN